MVALQAATSDTIVTGRARIARVIGDAVNLRIGDIKKTIDSKAGSYRDPSGSITVSRRASWLGDFLTASQKSRLRKGKGVRRNIGGLALNIRKRSSGKYGISDSIVRAFPYIMPKHSRFIGVFQREGKKRLPIHNLRGPTALGIFLNAQGETGGGTLIDETVADLGEVLEKNLESQIDRFLK